MICNKLPSHHVAARHESFGQALTFIRFLWELLETIWYFSSRLLVWLCVLLENAHISYSIWSYNQSSFSHLLKMNETQKQFIQELVLFGYTKHIKHWESDEHVQRLMFSPGASFKLRKNNLHINQSEAGPSWVIYCPQVFKDQLSLTN